MNTNFPPADKKEVLLALIGKKDGEGSAEYYARITADSHDASTHKFTSSSQFPGVCQECGWIHPDLKCKDCGESMVDHAKVVALMIEADTLLTAIFLETLLIELEMSLRSSPRRNPFNPLNWFN